MEIVIDFKNYTSFRTSSRRKAARAIISRGSKYLLIRKYEGMQFAGSGIEEGSKSKGSV